MGIQILGNKLVSSNRHVVGGVRDYSEWRAPDFKSQMEPLQITSSNLLSYK